MQLEQRQKGINEDEGPHLAAPQLEVFGMVGKPLRTSFSSGAPVKTVSARIGHSTPLVTMSVYANPRELHQPGEKPQVSRSRRCRNSVSDLRITAV